MLLMSRDAAGQPAHGLHLLGLQELLLQQFPCAFRHPEIGHVEF
jgi:hypothetical protein